ncbi:hypothetical protein CJ198_13915 [Brevibacterium luteolum]|uniref:Glycosyl transferase family 28 C-terminal domain-containing protein n=1 Tax=Brevibacterium luteolum TaxID=199591 RepID=A0A2N6PE60_9MICO|nr:hypothetical protein CJ198_13915 [Brevibacterium luteolum]
MCLLWFTLADNSPIAPICVLAALVIAGGLLILSRPSTLDHLLPKGGSQAELRRDVAQLMELVRNLDDRGRMRTDRVTKAIADERAKESRHEYHMNRAIVRIEDQVRQTSIRAYMNLKTPSDLERNTVLFVTSNGAGLGHLTRSLAIIKHLPKHFRAELLTLSTAYEILEKEGIAVHYFPSAEKENISPVDWNLEFGRFISSLLNELRPRVVIFDGTWVYPALTEGCRMLGSHLIWMQRGCWREEVDSRSPQRHAAARVCDEVIIPGDFGCDEQVDVGPHVRVSRTAPIVLTAQDEQLSRSVACQALALDPERRYFLVNLGGGSIFDGQEALDTIAEALEASPGGWAAVVCQSPLSANDLPDSVISVEAYPVARYFAAFEFAVTAAGYNSVQENVTHGMPMILVPNSQTVTDDQTRRAHGVVANVGGYIAQSAAELREALQQSLMAESSNSLDDSRPFGPPAEGAREASKLIVQAASEPTWKERLTKGLRIGTPPFL